MGGKTSLLTPLINYKALALCVRLKKCQLMKGLFETRSSSPKDKFGSLLPLGRSARCM
jgi:hypothetical protein